MVTLNLKLFPSIGDGAVDRYHWAVYNTKFRNQIYAIRHILNTGQGVVMEGSSSADYIHFYAACNQGWIKPESKIFVEKYYVKTHRVSCV